MYAAKISEFEAKAGASEKAHNELHSKYVDTLINSELARTFDNIKNLDRAKAGILRDTILRRNQFELTNVDGVEKLLNKGDYKSVQDITEAYVKSDEGKFFLLNNNSGGGAPGSNGARSQIENPWRKDTFNLTRQMEIAKENPELARQLEASAGKN